MPTRWMRIAAIVLAALPVAALPVAAAAREAPEWTACDFGLDPQAGIFATRHWLENGREEGALRTARGAVPAAGVAACTTVLASPDLTAAAWLRRVALLQARAAHRIAAGDAKGALADLDAIPAAIASDADRAESGRSIAVGSLLLRSVALAWLGQGDAARTAAAAAAMRPWNLRVQSLAAALIATAPRGGTAVTATADRMVALDANARELRARLRADQGDFPGALADWRRVRPAVAETTNVFVQVPGVRVAGAPGVPLVRVDAERVGAAAIVAALAGDAVQARAWMAAAKAAAAARPPGNDLERSFGIVSNPAAMQHDFDLRAALVEAAITLQTGNADGAVAQLRAIGPLPDDGGTRVLLVNIVAKRLRAATGGFVGGATIEPRALFVALPRYQLETARNSYSAKVFMFKPAGFAVRPAPDGRATTIEFRGNSATQSAVEEMTLLRAADFALASGKPGFIITGRRDLQRTQTMTYAGNAIGPARPVGFVTQLDVVAVDPKALPADLSNDVDRVIAAADVVAGLAPVYREPLH